MKKIMVLFCAVFALMLTACQTFGTLKNPQDFCKYSLSVTSPKAKFSLKNVTVESTLSINNVNTKMPVKIKKFEGTLLVNGKTFGNVFFGAHKIEPSSTQKITTTLTVPYSKLGKNLISLITSNSSSLTYKVQGDIYLETPMGSLPFPVSVTAKPKKS